MRSRVSGKKTAIRQIKGVLAINKKSAMAVCLILVMVFMWGRLLFSGGSDVKEAKGNTMPVTAPVGSGHLLFHLERVELPVISGRNDVIKHDMFRRSGWVSSEKNTVTVESQPVTETGVKTEEMMIRQIARSVDLGAIIDGVKGEAKEAFVEGELVSVGSKVRVKHSDRVYEFTVEDVMRDKVVLKWNELTIAIKMSEANGVSRN